jgi:hypothetical protein
VVHTFLAVFPEVHSFLGIYNAETPALVLVGRVPNGAGDRLTIDLDRLAAQHRPRSPGALRSARSAYENRPELRYGSLAELLPRRTPPPGELLIGRDHAAGLRASSRLRDGRRVPGVTKSDRRAPVLLKPYCSVQLPAPGGELSSSNIDVEERSLG